jgi:tetrapyrrole methylase family protein/MazG family protein
VAKKETLTNNPSFDGVLALIARLRGEDGCPWDRKQTPSTLAVYLIEEVYELIDAIGGNDSSAIEEELGDVLFQVLFLMYLYQQQGRFAPRDIIRRNLDKMISRHPHVFEGDKLQSAGQVKKRWREIKQQEKSSTGAGQSLLDSVPAGMPALMRAYRISERAAGAGFDWDSLAAVMRQSEAEWDEFKAEIRKKQKPGTAADAAAAMEFGDTLFTMVNVARLAGIHPETALAASTQKFINRFKQMEDSAAAAKRALDTIDRDELERLWEAAKQNDS